MHGADGGERRKSLPLRQSLPIRERVSRESEHAATAGSYRRDRDRVDCGTEVLDIVRLLNGRQERRNCTGRRRAELVDYSLEDNGLPSHPREFFQVQRRGTLPFCAHSRLLLYFTAKLIPVYGYYGIKARARSKERIMRNTSRGSLLNPTIPATIRSSLASSPLPLLFSVPFFFLVIYFSLKRRRETNLSLFIIAL